MIPSLLIGDWLFVNKLRYGPHLPFTSINLPGYAQPQRGEVVVFESPYQADEAERGEDPTPTLVKRLVGSPGDTLAMDGGVLIRNGVRLDEESYTRHIDPNYDPTGDEFRWQRDFLVPQAQAARTAYRPSRNNWGRIVVPQAHYFVLGDNRDNSLDSRYWGFVPDSMVRGTPLVVYYSYVPDSTEALDWVTHVRWKRLGTRPH